jgi:hypothetical protein
MLHVIHIMKVIGGYILPLTFSLKVGNNDTCKWFFFFFFFFFFTFNFLFKLLFVEYDGHVCFVSGSLKFLKGLF